jgi:ubiquinone/menaquinone biosynthesis C-methylase UbiE
MAERTVPEEWGSDFFGGLNDFPPEPVAGIGHILDAMAALPAFREARQWVLANLSVPPGGSILEAGCGNGASHADLQGIVGPSGRIVGIDHAAGLENVRTRASWRTRQAWRSIHSGALL